MKREKYNQAILDRINTLPEGSVFILSDFADIASSSVVKMAISRIKESNIIRHIMRGIYYKPRYSKLLNETVAVDPVKVAYAIARKNCWSVSPEGDTALNLLRLSTQVPATWTYVSNGPYKEYSYGKISILFKHTSNKETSGYSYITGLLIQGLRALGKENVTDNIKEMLRSNISNADKKIILKEAQTTTYWIYEYIKDICKEEY